MREDTIHYYVRKYLKQNNWKLIAGQYPNGSDDEVPPFYMVDPLLARDDSPDHRRHSMNKFVPDLLAIKDNYMLIIEMKPNYSLVDEVKLTTMISEKSVDLITALKNFNDRNNKLTLTPQEYIFIPALGFNSKSLFTRNDQFCYFLVSKTGEVNFKSNTSLQSI